MPQFISPGVYVLERDFSEFAASLATTALGLVGTARRGPINEPTFISSAASFLETFGEPDANQYGPYAALNYLRRGNQLWYVRVATEFEDGAALFTDTVAGSVVPAADGYTYSFEVAAGYDLSTGDYVLITEDGKASTVGLITDVTDSGDAGAVVTVDVPLNDDYTTAATVAVSPAVDGLSVMGAVKAEVWGLTREGGTVSRVVKLQAKNEGDWANFGTSAGLELAIEDGGQFSNLNADGTAVESEEGIPLQGVVPTVPSVDSVSELYAMGSSNGVRVHELRGVNSVCPTFHVLEVTMDGSDRAVLTLEGDLALSRLEAGEHLTVNGTGLAELDGSTHVVYDVAEDGDDVAVTLTTTVAEGAADLTGSYAEDLDDTSRSAVVFRCLSVAASSSKWTPVGLLTKRLRVLYKGSQVEVFDNLRVDDPTSDNYWNNALASSQYVTADYQGAGQQPVNTYARRHPYNPRLLMGLNTTARVSATVGASQVTLRNVAGNGGAYPDAAGYVGTVDEVAGTRSGLQHFRNSTSYDVNMLAVPGITLADVVLELIDVVEDRGDCLALVDPPLGLNVQEVVDWHNGTGPYTGDHAAFVSNKAALYWPWIQQFDPYTNRDLWLPPSAVVSAVIAYSDSVGETWFAPAGIVRGTVTNARRAERVIERGDMDLMYGPGNGNAVNPIMTFAKDGIVVYGNRTLQRTPTKLASIHVRRLLFYLEKVAASAARRLNFEQNDEVLWSQLRNLLEPLFDSVSGRRALEWYKLVCDETTNPPALRNNNECQAKLYLIPTGVAEKILLNFTLFASGANVEEMIALDNQ